jgi:hypothetical protein
MRDAWRIAAQLSCCSLMPPALEMKREARADMKDE